MRFYRLTILCLCVGARRGRVRAELDDVPAAVARGDGPAARRALLQHRAARGPHALERELALLPRDAHDVRRHDTHHTDLYVRIP